MRRRGLWAACVALLVGVVGVLAVGTGSANDQNAAGTKCSEATLHGTYLVGHHGVEIMGNKKVPFAQAGYEVYDGNGHVNGVFSGNIGGETFSNFPNDGTYTVKADCTGTTSFKGGFKSDLYIAPDGSMYTFVQTKPSERVAAGFELRGTAKRVGD